MFKRVGLIGLCCWSLSSFATFTDTTGAFKGGGMWKTSKGSTGNWSSDMTVSRDTKGGITLKEVLTLNHPGGQHVETVEWTAVPVGNDFYDVLVGGNKMGDLICFSETCQLKMNMAGDDSYGEVFHFSEGKIFRQGYNFSSADKVAWDGVMVP